MTINGKTYDVSTKRGAMKARIAKRHARAKKYGYNPNDPWYKKLWGIFKKIFSIIHNFFLWLASKLVNAILFIIEKVLKIASKIGHSIAKLFDVKHFGPNAVSNTAGTISKTIMDKFIKIKVSIKDGIDPTDKGKLGAKACSILAIATQVGIGLSVIGLLSLPFIPESAGEKREKERNNKQISNNDSDISKYENKMA